MIQGGNPWNVVGNPQPFDDQAHQSSNGIKFSCWVASRGKLVHNNSLSPPCNAMPRRVVVCMKVCGCYLDTFLNRTP